MAAAGVIPSLSRCDDSCGGSLLASSKLNNDPLLLDLLETPGVCIAGGFVVINEVDGLEDTGSSDVDVWIYGLDADARSTTFAAVTQKLLAFDPSACQHQIGSSVVSFHLSNYPRVVQLILVKTDSPWGVIRRFDIEVCKAFYAHQVSCGFTQLAAEGWRDRVVRDSSGNDKKVDNHRLAKLRRRGFAIEMESFSDPGEDAMQAYTQRNPKCTAKAGDSCSMQSLGRFIPNGAFHEKRNYDPKTGLDL